MQLPFVATWRIFARAGKKMPVSRAKIEMTTNSSITVKPVDATGRNRPPRIAFGRSTSCFFTRLKRPYGINDCLLPPGGVLLSTQASSAVTMDPIVANRNLAPQINHHDNPFHADPPLTDLPTASHAPRSAELGAHQNLYRCAPNRRRTHGLCPTAWSKHMA